MATGWHESCGALSMELGLPRSSFYRQRDRGRFGKQQHHEKPSAIIAASPQLLGLSGFLNNFYKLPESKPVTTEVAFTSLQSAGTELLEGISYAKPLK